MTWPSLPTRERDAMVAEKVMGWENLSEGWWWHQGAYIHKTEFSPSTSIADAFKVVEKMKSEGHLVTISTVSSGVALWAVCFYGHAEDAVVESNSLPEAICLAALRAKGVEV